MTMMTSMRRFLRGWDAAASAAPPARAATLFFSLAAIGSALAAPPRVIKAVPDNGDIDVRPGLTEIRVTFDQPMRRGSHSWVGGGDAFPKVLGAPQWADDRTAFLRVRLEPNHAYWLSVNNAQYQNFVSKRGEAATPYPISFRTGAGGAEDSVDAARLNAMAAEELGRLIDERYSYRDHGSADWSQLYPRAAARLSRTQTPKEFAEAAATVLARARDLHLWLELDGERIPTYVNPVTPNCNAKLLPEIVPGFERRHAHVASGKFVDENVGYLQINAWDAGEPELVKAALEALDEFSDCAGLVIDVRLNGGGSETLAREVAGCFIDEPVVYAQHVIRDPGAEGGFSKPQKRVLKPNADGPHYRGPVAVLIGPAVVSSCEAFVLMMQQVDGCKLVGAPTRGSSGNPQAYALPNGVTVYLPCWKAMTPAGEVFEGRGIEPDTPVRAGRTSFKRDDPVLRRALRELQRADR